ncbi:MAG: DoxX family protein [Flavobacteriaceae bacterium]|jgi:uncharacterized membrane protein YphA (DoxX/SURF4 family)|nr:DoxX family protein [Flavobacteriaceae bacterium]
MRYLVVFFRIIVGIIFIISGFVKTVDPLGFSYKLEEYFGAGVFNLPFFEKLAFPMSIFFVILEIMLGVLLLLGTWKKFTVWLLLLLIVFFAFLTFYSAYFDKVTDCGCFGDAIKLKPWTSFRKDIVLLAMILILFFGIKYINPIFSGKINISLLIISFLICCGIAYWGIAHLPIIDFRPYAVGKNLKQGMQDGSSQVDKISYILQNLKDNKNKTMSSDEYINSGIWQDTLNWKIIKTDVQVIKEAVLPSVHDFIVDCGADGDQTDNILDENKIAVFTVPFADMLSTTDKAELMKIASEFSQHQIKFVILASNPKALAPLRACSTDPTTLKTINRSNPGLMILKKGEVAAKYNVNDFPDYQEINKL